MPVDELLHELVAKDGSDLHLLDGLVPMRIEGLAGRIDGKDVVFR